jgi:hypothetical protein
MAVRTNLNDQLARFNQMTSLQTTSTLKTASVSRGPGLSKLSSSLTAISIKAFKFSVATNTSSTVSPVDARAQRPVLPAKRLSDECRKSPGKQPRVVQQRASPTASADDSGYWDGDDICFFDETEALVAQRSKPVSISLDNH